MNKIKKNYIRFIDIEEVPDTEFNSLSELLLIPWVIDVSNREEFSQFSIIRTSAPYKFRAEFLSGRKETVGYIDTTTGLDDLPEGI